MPFGLEKRHGNVPFLRIRSDHFNESNHQGLLFYTDSCKKAHMVRPREFDLDTVADRALDLFSRDGYDRASLTDLEQATGVDRKGLYNTFGSKRGLFVQALKRYEDQANRLILEPLESAGAGRPEIGHVFSFIASQRGQLKGNRGCLFCLTTQSDVVLSKEVAEHVHGYLQRLREGFASALRNAQSAGDLAAHKEPEILADFLMGTLMGLSAMTRARRPKVQIMRYVETALSTLD
jgi:TetR/AcrR family transcriptional repressor of nem operon